MELACTQKNNCSSRNDELWFGKETDVIGLIREALLILVQPQLVAELLFHSLRYKKLARRSPIAGEPMLAHPRRHGCRRNGQQPIRQIAWCDG